MATEKSERATLADVKDSRSRQLRAIKLSVLLYIAIFTVKLGAFFLTNVTALLAEALHTLSDILLSGFLLFAAVYSQKEADETYMFGYGRAQNVAALVAATLFLSFTSFRLYEEAIPRVLWPVPTTYRDLSLGIGVLILSMLLAATPLISLLREEKRGAAARAQLAELVNDELGLLAALVGILFILNNEPIADPIASIIVASIIAFNAIRLFRQNASLLMGRSPGREFLDKVNAVAKSVDGVLDVHDARAEYVGPEIIQVQMHIIVRKGLAIEEAHRISEEVRQRVMKSMQCQYCIVHVGSEAHYQ